MKETGHKIQEMEEISALLDTIEGGSRVCVQGGKARELKGGVNMCTSQQRGEVPDLMKISPTREF